MSQHAVKVDFLRRVHRQNVPNRRTPHQHNKKTIKVCQADFEFEFLYLSRDNVQNISLIYNKERCNVPGNKIVRNRIVMDCRISVLFWLKFTTLIKNELIVFLSSFLYLRYQMRSSPSTRTPLPCWLQPTSVSQSWCAAVLQSIRPPSTSPRRPSSKRYMEDI